MCHFDAFVKTKHFFRDNFYAIVTFSSNFCHQPWASIDHAGVQTRANPSIGISPHRDTCSGGNASPTSFTWPSGCLAVQGFHQNKALGKGKIYISWKNFTDFECQQICDWDSHFARQRAIISGFCGWSPFDLPSRSLTASLPLFKVTKNQPK